MKTNTPAMVCPGNFQWNGGGWIGASLGSTAWMIVTAGFLVANQQLFVALVPFCCFVVTNAVAAAIWSRRDRTGPFPGFILLLSVLTITLPLAWIATTLLGGTDALARMHWPTSWLSFVPLVIAAPAMMLWFFLRQWRSKHCL